MNKNLLFTLFLLIILAITSISAIFKTKKITTAHLNSRNNPDFYMINTTHLKFDKNGDICNEFYSSKISHFDNNNSYFFNDPHIKIYNPGEAPWDVTAQNGKSQHGKSEIHLWNNVRVIQAADTQQPSFDIASEKLIVFPDTKYAETDAPVTIIQESSTATAIGAKANLQEGNIELLKNVECLYNSQ